MFVVRVQLKIQPEQQGRFRAHALFEVPRAKQLDGCREYAFCEDLSDSSRVLLYEEWATRKDFEAYKASEVFAMTGAQLRPLLAEPPKSAYYESEDVFATFAAR